MKRLLVVAVLGTLLGVAGGCRIGECWTYAWNSRFHPERNVPACSPASWSIRAAIRAAAARRW